jgi:hypothetical protein
MPSPRYDSYECRNAPVEKMPAGSWLVRRLRVLHRHRAGAYTRAVTGPELEVSLFDEIADMLRGIAPGELGDIRHRAHRYGIKAWFGSDTPLREHYEAQVIGPREVKNAKVLALEIGFHSEYPKVADNDAVLDHLLAQEKRWRRLLGRDAEAGVFLGRADNWRRVSETWLDPDLSDPEMVLEIAVRLVAYITALEPVRRQRLAA